MKYYNREKLPNIEQMPMEDRWYYTITRDKFDFVCSMFIHDLLMHPIYNTFLVLFLIFGCWHAIEIGDMGRLISYIGVVLFVKIRSIVLIAKLYNAYQKGICHSFDVDGVNVVVDVGNEGTDYKHFTSLLWEQIRRIVVYGDFMVIDVDRQYRDKVKFEMAIIFTKDIERVSNQALYLWKRALDTKPEERKYIYAGNEIDEVIYYIENRFGEIESILPFEKPNLRIGIAKIPPTDDRDYYTLCTIGAGAFRMPVDSDLHVKEGVEKHAEYMLILPKDWKLDEESLNDDRYLWPYHLLLTAAQFPLDSNDFLMPGRTIKPKDNQPLNPAVPYTAALFSNPIVGDTDQPDSVALSSGMNISVYQAVPITQEEWSTRFDMEAYDFYIKIFGSEEYDESVTHLLQRLQPYK